MLFGVWGLQKGYCQGSIRVTAWELMLHNGRDEGLLKPLVFLRVFASGAVQDVRV